MRNVAPNSIATLHRGIWSNYQVPFGEYFSSYIVFSEPWGDLHRHVIFLSPNYGLLSAFLYGRREQAQSIACDISGIFVWSAEPAARQAGWAEAPDCRLGARKAQFSLEPTFYRSVSSAQGCGQSCYSIRMALVIMGSTTRL